MPPLPPNSTDVFFVDYEGQFGSATMQFRTKQDLEIAQYWSLIRDFLVTAVAPIWHESVTVTGARRRADSSDVTLPYPVGDPITGEAVGAWSPVNNPRFITVVGRGPVSGRRVRLFIYGTIIGVDNDYRVPENDAAAVDLLLTSAQVLAGAGALVTIAEDSPDIYNYVNTGYNSYKQRRQRRIA